MQLAIPRVGAVHRIGVADQTRAWGGILQVRLRGEEIQYRFVCHLVVRGRENIRHACAQFRGDHYANGCSDENTNVVSTTMQGQRAIPFIKWNRSAFMTPSFFFFFFSS